MNVTKIFTSVSSGAGANVGFGHVTFDDIIIVQLGIMKRKSDGALFVSWPQRLGKDKEGNPKYHPQAGFTEEAKEFKNEVENAIIEDFSAKLNAPAAKKEEPKKTYAQKAEEEQLEPAPQPRKKLWNTKK